MPSVSKKQHNLMAAVASNPAFAKKAGIPQRVGADFIKADKGRKFAKGGDMAKKMPPFMGKETKAEEAKEMKVKAKSPAMYRKGEKAEGIHGESGMEKPTKYAKGGGCELKGKTKAQQFAMGGMSVGMAPRPRMGMSGPGMVRPSMTPEGSAAMVSAIKGMGGRKSSPEDQARGEQIMKRAGVARPQFNPADTDKVRARMNVQMARQGMAPTVRPTGMKEGGCAKTFAKGGGCELKGKTKGRII